MKNLALILFCLMMPFSLVACSNSNKKGLDENPRKTFEDTRAIYIDTQSKTSFGDETSELVLYLNTNYDCYDFSRYISYGVSSLVQQATQEEFVELKDIVSEIKQAIESNENLYHQEYELATGAVAKVYDLDTALFNIWYRVC